MNVIDPLTISTIRRFVEKEGNVFLLLRAWHSSIKEGEAFLVPLRQLSFCFLSTVFSSNPHHLQSKPPRSCRLPIHAAVPPLPLRTPISSRTRGQHSAAAFKKPRAQMTASEKKEDTKLKNRLKQVRVSFALFVALVERVTRASSRDADVSLTAGSMLCLANQKAYRRE
jgi:hypothetical protein